MRPRPEVRQLFDLPQILRHNARFDLNKLHWLNGEYIREMTRDRFHELAVHALKRAGIDANVYPLDYVKAALDTCKAKVKQFVEVPLFADFYFREALDYDPEMVKKEFTPAIKAPMQHLREAFARTEKFDAATLNTVTKGVAAEMGVGIGVLVHPARLIATGRTVGPSLYDLLAVLGRERVLSRLDRVLERAG